MRRPMPQFCGVWELVHRASPRPRRCDLLCPPEVLGFHVEPGWGAQRSGCGRKHVALIFIWVEKGGEVCHSADVGSRVAPPTNIELPLQADTSRWWGGPCAERPRHPLLCCGCRFRGLFYFRHPTVDIETLLIQEGFRGHGPRQWDQGRR